MNKGNIWLVELPSTNGYEQTGKRPVIFIADSKINIAIIIPLTSNLQALRFPHTIEVKPSEKNGLNTISIALIFQVRAIDKKRLQKKIGELEDSLLHEVDKLLKKILQL